MVIYMVIYDENSHIRRQRSYTTKRINIRRKWSYTTHGENGGHTRNGINDMAIAVYLQTTPAKLLQITVADSHIRMHIGGGLEMCRAAARGGL